MRDSAIFYRSFYEAIKELPTQNQAELYTAIFEYSLNFNEVELKGLSKTIFTLIKPQLEANNKRFESGKKPKSIQSESKTELKRKQEGSETEAKPKQNESETEANQKQTESKTEANVNNNVNNNENNNNNLNFLLEKETKENLGNSNLDDPVKTPDPEKEKSCAKKENPKPPDLAEFLDYAKETYQNELKRDFSPFAFAVRSKYESWINADWKDGNGKQIKNWKSKLKNTIPHLKPIYNGTNNYTAGAVNGNQKPTGKVSARTILAQRLSAANAANSESGNITVDIEAQ